jgi:alpha-D-xyloside xylohydrolase
MQRYAAATWSGDISSRWHDMQNQVSAGINFSLSGMPYWTMDAGGFAVEDKYLHPTAEESEEWRELMTRWYQFGAFVPLFRVHGQPPSREIYNVAPETHPAYKSMLYYGKLRYRLMPYIYSVAAQIYLNNYTMMRGLVMDFAADEAVKNISDEYMFGPSLLVSPVFNYKQRSRTVYLPKGQGWYNLYTGNYLEGGQSVSADAAYEQMPVFVKAGAIIPFGPELQYTAEKNADTITLYVYAGKDGAFTLYEDEGLNYNYEKGLFANIKFVYSENNQSITINEREGAFPGMLKKRYFRIKYNRKETESALGLDNREGQIITYNGKKQIVHLK